jgi:signal transduction histidine kinase
LRVFERFTRGGRAGGGGTGLGLAIARWVVDLHGGSIAVVDPGDDTPGCHIRVILPRH